MLTDAQEGSTIGVELHIRGRKKGNIKFYHVCYVLVHEIANICQSFIAITVQNKTANEI